MTPDPVSCTLSVSKERAWQLLEDPRALKLLVVGARNVRRFDARWPEVGTTVHHTVGVAPLVIRDTTEVIASEPGHRLVLEARVRPFGSFEVDFALRDHDGGCLLEVRERVIGGPLSGGRRAKVVDTLVKIRNVELCRRFQRLVERREQQLERLRASRTASAIVDTDA